MKKARSITFGLMCLFGASVMAFTTNDSSEINSADKTSVEEVKEGCSMVYDECDALYPNSYEGFADCYARGGC